MIKLALAFASLLLVGQSAFAYPYVTEDSFKMDGNSNLKVNSSLLSNMFTTLRLPKRGTYAGLSCMDKSLLCDGTSSRSPDIISVQEGEKDAKLYAVLKIEWHYDSNDDGYTDDCVPRQVTVQGTDEKMNLCEDKVEIWLEIGNISENGTVKFTVPVTVEAQPKKFLFCNSVAYAGHYTGAWKSEWAREAAIAMCDDNSIREARITLPSNAPVAFVKIVKPEAESIPEEEPQPAQEKTESPTEK